MAQGRGEIARFPICEHLFRAFVVFVGRFLDTRTGIESGQIARAEARGSASKNGTAHPIGAAERIGIMRGSLRVERNSGR